MKSEMKIHCLFEQSGTFKNEFKKLGFEAEDYDILNQFGQTDHIVDLFKEIEVSYEGLEVVEKRKIESCGHSDKERSIIYPQYARRFIRTYLIDGGTNDD